MLSQAKVKWAEDWLKNNPQRSTVASSGNMIHSFNDTSCCGLIELDGWSDSRADYNNRNKALFYQRLGDAEEALVYATTTPDQIHAEAFLKEAGFKPSVRGKSWKTNNIITIWTLALRSVRAKNKPDEDNW